jgi:hypothetical protein
MWSMLTDTQYGWTAVSLVTSFLSFLITAVPELVTWIFYLYGERFWFSWWANNIGFWFSVVGMGLPVIASILQLGLQYGHGGFSGDTTVEFGSHIIWLLSMGIPMWVQSATMHLTYANRLKCFAIANPPKRSEKEILADCELNRDDFELDVQYASACAAVVKVKEERAARTAAARSAPSDFNKETGEAW